MGNIFGFLNIDKPEKMTSHDVISKLRKITGIKQIGHSGTLDPFATGVLPIAIGKATKLIQYLPDDKEYLATVQFGKNTDTYDVEGEITEEFSKKINKSELLKALKNFEGKISQLPPIYSAIKVNGKKLYDYARKGQQVEIKPREVTIYKIILENFDEQNQTAQIRISCSKGTYIRSIAYDLGKNLGCGAYLSGLRRTKAGNFDIARSVTLDTLSSELTQKIISPTKIFDFPIHNLEDFEAEKVFHGNYIKNVKFKDSDIVFLVYGGKIIAIGVVDKDKILVKNLFEVL